jgi:hypothetical protein
MKGSEKNRRRRERSRVGGRGEKRRNTDRPRLESTGSKHKHDSFKGSDEVSVEKTTRMRRQREAVRKRVIGRRRKGGKVRRVGTEKRSGGRRKTRENRPGVERVTEYWVSGMLTNQGARYSKPLGHGMSSDKGRGGATGKKRGGGDMEYPSNNSKPSLVVLRNGEVQTIVMREALRCGIPTVGIVTPGRSAEGEARRTYGRPWKHDGVALGLTSHLEQQGIERRVSRRKKARRKQSRVVPLNKHRRKYNSRKDK